METIKLESTEKKGHKINLTDNFGRVAKMEIIKTEANSFYVWKHEITTSQKVNIISYLEKHGWNSANFECAMDRCAAEMIDDLETTKEQSLTFCIRKTTEWLRLFNRGQFSGDCFYAAALIMNAIMEMDTFPLPEGAIDLKEIYGFVTSGLLGLPQKKLSSKSANFVAREFQRLIEEVTERKLLKGSSAWLP